MSNIEKKALIIGAGPAGLTAGYELLDKTDIQPIVFELSNDLGGISKTVNYKGNRIDIGGHRFFSKSERVVQWWKNILPLQGEPSADDRILKRDIPLSKQNAIRPLKAKTAEALNHIPDPEKEDNVFLYRGRLSRIYFLRKLFAYPISLSIDTLSKLGIIRTCKIVFSYLRVRVFRLKEENNLEDFFINRFGRELYKTFFKDFTEKVWGVPCQKIKPEWGAQRIKGLSISKAVAHAFKSLFKTDKSLDQKEVETSLIGQFMYPKFGPGQMWERTAEIIQENNGQVHMNQRVVGIKTDGFKVQSLELENTQTKERTIETGEYFFSTMPVKELINALDYDVPQNIKDIANGLMYRDFMTLGLLVDRLKIENNSKIKTVNGVIPDNWIYIQEPDVRLCRLQVFNNWSPYLVADPEKVWLGLEYMVNDTEELWNLSDKDFTQLAIDELAKINIIDQEDVLDSTVIRMPKAYPAYFGTYDRMDELRQFINQFENLFLIGRNGMHRYNNQDHSMLTAMVAVENIINGVKTKENLWNVNVEKEYHEEKK